MPLSGLANEQWFDVSVEQIGGDLLANDLLIGFEQVEVSATLLRGNFKGHVE